MSTRSFTVVGMTCDHRVRSVKEVSDIDGVNAITVDLESGLVTVGSDGDVDDGVLLAAIDEAGYEVAS